MSESNNNIPMRITQLEEATSYEEGMYFPVAKVGGGTKKIKVTAPSISPQMQAKISYFKDYLDVKTGKELPVDSSEFALQNGKKLLSDGSIIDNSAYNILKIEMSSKHIYKIKSNPGGDYNLIRFLQLEDQSENVICYYEANSAGSQTKYIYGFEGICYLCYRNYYGYELKKYDTENGSTSEEITSKVEFLYNYENILKIDFQQGTFDGGGNNISSDTDVRTELISFSGTYDLFLAEEGYTVYFYKEGTYSSPEFTLSENQSIYLNNNYRLKVAKNNETLSADDVYQNVGLFKKTVVPKTRDLSFSYSKGGMYPDGSYSSSETGTSFKIVASEALTIGKKYRISVNEGFNLLIKHGYQRRCIYDTQMIDVVADSSTMNICIVSADGTVYTDDNIAAAANVKLSEIIYTNNLEYDYIVAAVDSPEKFKNIADIVCDGINDEVEIQCAINGNISNGQYCKVLLAQGTYNIGRFHHMRPNYSSAYYDSPSPIMSAITPSSSWINGNNPGQYETMLLGATIDLRNKGTGFNPSAEIVISKALIDTLDISKEYCVFSTERNPVLNPQAMNSDGTMTKINHYHNFKITLGANTKKIIGIDAVGSFGLGVENVMVAADFEGDFVYFDTACPEVGSCGIRGDHGSSNGYGKSYIKQSAVIGLYEGIALTGEHFVIENCIEKACYYGVTIGNWPVAPRLEHPNVFIGNSIEQCYRLMLLNRYGADEESEAESPEQTVVYIGGSSETTAFMSEGVTQSTLPIKEIIKGAYRGRIETDYRGRNIPLFETGSGENIVSTTY